VLEDTDSARSSCPESGRSEARIRDNARAIQSSRRSDSDSWTQVDPSRSNGGGRWKNIEVARFAEEDALALAGRRNGVIRLPNIPGAFLTSVLRAFGRSSRVRCQLAHGLYSMPEGKLAPHRPDIGLPALAEIPPAPAETQSSLAALLNPIVQNIEATEQPRPVIGRFEIVRHLGGGGFGVVYQARDTELGRQVALKLMRTDRLGATDRLALLDMFRAEAAAAAKLNHPNVVTIHDFGIDEGIPYLVLELLTGETLSRRIQRGRLSPAEGVAILIAICRGLIHTHAAGVIHRDLKPGNVFLREDGEVKILDFGLAQVEKALVGGDAQGAASSGTPAYMAPEQWQGGAQDERTDVFAGGVILFEMLCGERPFPAPEDGRNFRDEGQRALAGRMPGIPPWLVAVAERALAADPNGRYASAQELLDALAGGGAKKLATVPQRGSRLVRRALIGAAAVTVLAGAAAAVSVLRGSRAAAQEASLRAQMRTAATAADPLLGALILAEFVGRAEPPGGLAAAVLVGAKPIALVEHRAEGEITGVATSADGHWIATLEHRVDHETPDKPTGAVHLWRSDGTGRGVVLRGPGVPTCAAVSPDGKRVAALWQDGTLRIWNGDGSGGTTVAQSGRSNGCEFTGDGTRIIVEPSAVDPTGRLWPVDGEGEPLAFRDVISVEVSSDGRHILTTRADRQGFDLWNADGSLAKSWTGPLRRATFAGDFILTGHGGHQRLWQGDLSASVEFPGGRRPAAVSPDGRFLASNTDRGIQIRATDGTGQPVELNAARGNADTIDVSFSGDGSRLAFVGDSDVRLFWTDGLGEPTVVQRFDSGTVPGGGYLTDGARLLTFAVGGASARIFSGSDSPGVTLVRPRGLVGSVAAVSADQTLLLDISARPGARVLPLGGGAPVVLPVPSAIVRLLSATLSPDGKRVAATDGSGRVLVWAGSGREPRVTDVHAAVPGLAFSPDGALLAALTADDTGFAEVIVFRSDGSEEVARRSARAANPPRGGRLFFSPDGSRLLVAGGRGLLFRTDRWEQKPIMLENDPRAGISTAAFHPQGMLVVTGSFDDTVQVWSLEGQERKDLRRSGGPFVAISPDGQRIAAGRADGTARITRFDGTGEPVELRTGSGATSWLAFAPDGRRLVTLNEGDPTVRSWLFEWADLASALEAATTACLTPAERESHLGERPEAARAAWDACERRHGRL
jgi:WD40 repeat protein